MKQAFVCAFAMLCTYVAWAGDSAGHPDSGAVPSFAARSVVFRDDVTDHFYEEPDSARTDSVPASVKRKLLPDNMSFLERTLWGEDGVVRGIGIASPLTPDVRKHELAVRRTMLTMHQIGGFLTLGSMFGAVYYGQKTLNDIKSYDLAQRHDRDMHQTFVATTLVLYGTTAMLSVLSPPPFIRRDEVSTTSIHKTLAWIHFGGMILTPILGKMINRRGSSYYEQARVHQISAYVTTAVFATSMIIITL